MSPKYPETERSEPAEKGTAAHELAATMIHAGARAGVGMPTRADTIGTEAANGIIYDDELFDSAETYASYMIGLMIERRVLGGPNLGIERRVNAPSVHPESFGFVDFFLYDQQANELIVADFKNGFGVVEAFENWQMANYAIGVMDTLGIAHVEKLRLIVAQPNAIHRDGPIREWVTDMTHLIPMVRQLEAGAFRALGPDPVTRSGYHCRYCRARHDCQAAIDAGPHLLEMVSDTSPVGLTTKQMASQYSLTIRAIMHLRSLSLAFEEQLKSKARSGEHIPGFRVETSFGREKWTKPFKEVVALGDLLGQDLRKREAITPTQARARGLDDKIVDAFATKDPTGPKLVPDNSKLARKVFSS